MKNLPAGGRRREVKPLYRIHCRGGKQVKRAPRPCAADEALFTRSGPDGGHIRRRKAERGVSIHAKHISYARKSGQPKFFKIGLNFGYMASDIEGEASENGVRRIYMFCVAGGQDGRRLKKRGSGGKTVRRAVRKGWLCSVDFIRVATG